MPGIKRARTHADEFKDLEEHAPIEYDPEDDGPIEDSNDDDSTPDDEVADGISGREHYAPVGKSSLRQREGAALGPQYAGSRVSRTGTGTTDEEHDPFAEYGSDETSEMDELEDEDSEAEEDDEEAGSDEFDGEDMDDGTDTDDTSVSDEQDEETGSGRPVQDERAELRRIMNEQKNVAASVSLATKQDAEKGRAVKRQRRNFDSLLNARVRLQQGLIAMNSMQSDTIQDAPKESKEEAYTAAETAALNLWNTIESLRPKFAQHRTTAPPSTLAIDSSTPTSKIWTHMQAHETHALPTRTSTLNKWSRKTASAAAQLQQTTTHRLNPSAASAQHQGTITSILDEQLSATNLPRLVARTRIPRSCAPLQAARGATADSDPAVYDDADFYAQLLQELLTQRQLEDLAQPAVSSAGASDALTQQYRAARAASKTKKDVDTKASKGRKIRYTVHEKLQNFMAPEDRGAWGERQREELFGSLLGRRLVLEEVEEREDEAGGGGDGDGREEEEALMLFRS